MQYLHPYRIKIHQRCTGFYWKPLSFLYDDITEQGTVVLGFPNQGAAILTGHHIMKLHKSLMQLEFHTDMLCLSQIPVKDNKVPGNQWYLENKQSTVMVCWRVKKPNLRAYCNSLFSSMINSIIYVTHYIAKTYSIFVLYFVNKYFCKICKILHYFLGNFLCCVAEPIQINIGGLTTIWHLNKC